MYLYVYGITVITEKTCELGCYNIIIHNIIIIIIIYTMHYCISVSVSHTMQYLDSFALQYDVHIIIYYFMKFSLFD